MGKQKQNGIANGEIHPAHKVEDHSRTNRHFRLVHLKNEFYTPITSLKNTKCTLEVHKAGLMISGDFCEKCKNISILSKNIKSIQLTRGRETIDTFYLSPIHILSEIGLPSNVSRHFSFHPTEYKIRQTKIRIETKEQELELISSGYRFEKLFRSLKNMGYGDKLKIERKPSVDLSDFKYSI